MSEEAEDPNKPSPKQIEALREAVESNIAVTCMKIGGDYLNGIITDLRETNLEAAKIKADATKEMPRNIAEAIKGLGGLSYVIFGGAIFLAILIAGGLLFAICFIAYHAIQSGQNDVLLLVLGATIYGGSKVPALVRRLFRPDSP